VNPDGHLVTSQLPFVAAVQLDIFFLLREWGALATRGRPAAAETVAPHS